MHNSADGNDGLVDAVSLCALLPGPKVRQRNALDAQDNHPAERDDAVGPHDELDDALVPRDDGEAQKEPRDGHADTEGDRRVDDLADGPAPQGQLDAVLGQLGRPPACAGDGGAVGADDEVRDVADLVPAKSSQSSDLVPWESLAVRGQQPEMGELT